MAVPSDFIQEQLSNFEAFKAQYFTLYELRLEFEVKDIGLHRAVSLAAFDFIENESFPIKVVQQEREPEYFFGMVDEAGIAKRKIVNVSRSKKNAKSASVFINLLENWRRPPETVKARKRNAVEVLTVFHFLTHHVTKEDGAPQPYYWARVMRDLVPEHILKERRAAHFEAKKQGHLKRTLDKQPDLATQVKSPEKAISPFGIANLPQPRISTERIQQLRDRLIGIPARRSLYYRLDYSDQENAFKFDPETFRKSSDEEHLDDVLIELSIMGGMIERGEATAMDLFPLRAIINVFVGSAEVDAYLEWLITPDEMPDDLSFLGAVNLYEQLGNEVEGGLARYRNNALRIIEDSFGD